MFHQCRLIGNPGLGQSAPLLTVEVGATGWAAAVAAHWPLPVTITSTVRAMIDRSIFSHASGCASAMA